MDYKQNFKTRITLLFVTLSLLQCVPPSESFFLPRFMRRQATSPPQQQKLNPASSRGQHGEATQQQQAAFRAINNNPAPPRPLSNFGFRQQGDSSSSNSNGNNQNNFQVPDALCLACEKFPWTPVQSSAPSVGTPSVIVIGGGGSENNIDEPAKPVVASSESKPQHYEVQIHKDRGIGADGTTVVINDLGTNPLSGDATQQQNTFVTPTGSSYGGPSPQAYNGPRQQTLLQPVPQSQNSAQQYGQPNQVQFGGQNQYGSVVQPTPTILQPNPNSINQYAPPQPFKTYSKIPLMNVGTIIAASHNAKPHDIQPGKLVYQEHMQIYGAPTQQSPNYGQPPPKPQGQYTPQQNFPQSYKLPIVSNRPNTGSISMNHIPLENVPNYVPIKPQGHGNYGAPPPQQGPQMPTGFMQPPGPPPGYNPPQQGYAPAQSGYLPPPPPQHGYRQPRPLPPAPPQQQQYRQSQPVPPPPPPQQSYQPQAPRPQQNYGNFAPLPPPQPPQPPQQQGYNQFPVQQAAQPSQQFFNQQPQDKPAAPPPPSSVPRPTPPNNLYGTPFNPPMPQLEMRPPPEHYFTPEIKMMPPLPPEPSPPPGYQSPSLEPDNSFNPTVDIRIPTQSVPVPQSEVTPLSGPNAEYSLQSVTNQVVFRDQFDKRPSLFPSPPTIPFGRPSEGTKHGSEFVKNPHLQSLDQVRGREKPVQPDATQQPSPSPQSLPASGGGRWEIVPATQYDITHLFNKNKGKSVDQQQTRKRPLPIPVPVPISESHVANSQNPVFVVGPHRPGAGQPEDQRQEGQGNTGIRYQPVQLETTIYTTTGPAPNQNGQSQQQQQQQYGGHQAQFDPLPPAVVRALYNSQRTSFLTHQHLTPEQNRDHNSPIFVNSVTVSESPPEETRSSASHVDPSKLASVQQIIDSPVRYGHGHGHSHNAQGQHIDQDQTVVNCQNSPQWVIPNAAGRQPAYVRQPITESNAQQQQLEQQPSKPYVYYYPSPMSSVYWVEKPASGASNQQQHQQQQPSQQDYGHRVPVTTIIQPQYGSELEANEAAQQTKPSYVKLSTVVSSSSEGENNVDNNSIAADAAGYENYSSQRQPSQERSKEQSGSEKNGHGNGKQVVEDDESDESSSIIQQVSTQAPYDILAFAKEPVYGSQSIDDVVDADGYEQSSTGSVTSEYTSTPEYGDDDEASSRTEVRPSISYSSFSSHLAPKQQQEQSSTMSPFYFIHNHRQVQNSDKMKTPKYVAGDDNSYRVVYDTKVGAQSHNYEVVGPTTLAECFTTPEPTTVITTTDTAASTDVYAAGTSTTGSVDDYTNYDIISTTFSPYRVNTQNRIRLHSSSRFPSGRPSPTTPVPLSETTALDHDTSPGSASVHVPIYRPAVTFQGESLLASSTERSESIADGKDEQPPSPPFNRISSTSRKVPAFTPSKRIPNQVEREREREPIIVESVPVLSAQGSDQQAHNALSSSGSTSTTTPSSSSNMTTKIVKTVRVRQRMRAGSPFGGSGVFRTRLAAATGQGMPSRIKVVQRPASQDYVKTFPEYAAPEGDMLPDEEQTEVKNALIEIKKVK